MEIYGLSPQLFGGINHHSYLSIVVVNLLLGSILFSRFYRKKEINLNRDRKIVRRVITIILSLTCLISTLFFFYSIYLFDKTEGQTALIASTSAGFILGFSSIPRFIFSNLLNTRRAIVGTLFVGFLSILLFKLIHTQLQLNQFPSLLSGSSSAFEMQLWFRFNLIDLLSGFLNAILSPVGLLSFLALPFWGLFGWLAHKTIHPRQHHFWSQDLSVFE
ncbi:MAG: hypothetical protein V7776_12235 [Halopseudomonas aestusnigri]